VDATGRRTRITPQWVAADPGMVSVTPTEGSEVTITVLRAGESRVQVISHGVSRELTLKAECQNEAIRVDIARR
jgi:hypothetical protein